MSKPAKRVCVSGATGFIAGHIIQVLLHRGYVVHATARRLSDPSRVSHVTSLPNAQQNLHLFEAELLEPESFDEPLKGCDFAVHCASPYTMSVKDPQRELVDPAVKGTESFLASCLKTGTVKKIVVTGSIAAVTDHGVFDKIFDENDWNDTSSLVRLPYYYSKVCAEKAVWSFAAAHPEITVIVINPTMVIGPSLTKDINASVSPYLGMVTGKRSLPGLIDLTWNVVDVRDVAIAHVEAIRQESCPSGRYICSCDRAVHLREVIAVIKSNGFRCNERDLTASWVSKGIRLVAAVSSDPIMTYTKLNLAIPTTLSNSKIKETLNLTFRDPEAAITDMLNDFVKWGHAQRSSAS